MRLKNKIKELNERTYWRIVYIAFIILFLGNTRVYLLAGEHAIVSQFSDDAYYYFEISKNLVEGRGLTFDSINQTNGFHPIWLLITSLPHLLISDNILYLRSIGLLSILLFSVALFYSYQRLVKLESLLVASVSILGIMYYFETVSRGMEITFLIPLVLYSLFYMKRKQIFNLETTDPLSLLWLGSLLALGQITRLDFVLFNIIITCYLFIINIKITQGSTKKFIAFVLPIIISGLGYLLFNYYTFRHFTPISSKVKSIGSSRFNQMLIQQINTEPRIIPLPNKQAVYIGMLIVSATYLAYYFLSRKDKTLDEQISLLVSLFCLTHFIYYFSFSASRLSTWYFYPTIFVMVWTLPQILTSVYSNLSARTESFNIIKSNDVPISYILGASLFVFLIVTSPWAVGTTDGFKTDNYELAEETNAGFEDEATLAMGDRAGSFGYFSDYSVIHIEGLVNNDKILPYLRNDTLNSYLKNGDVDYLVVHYDAPENYSSTTISPTHRTQTVETNIEVHNRCEVDTSTPHVVFDWECIESVAE